MMRRKSEESRRIYVRKENSEEKWNRKILTKYAIEVYYNPIYVQTMRETVGYTGSFSEPVRVEDRCGTIEEYHS